MDIIKDIFSDTSKVSILVACISTMISAIAVSVAVIYNIKIQKQYRNGLKPQLSMRLVEFKNILYLLIENTGKTAAQNIEIQLLSLEENGDRNDIIADILFASQFELYPGETVQGRIGIYGKNICNNVFPRVNIEVSYIQDGMEKKISYRRSVSFTIAYDNKILADVNWDKSKLEEDLKSISRAMVRTANYLDGCQVASFDELDILAQRSLKDDIDEILHEQSTNIETNIKSRKDTIEMVLKNRGASFDKGQSKGEAVE